MSFDTLIVIDEIIQAGMWQIEQNATLLPQGGRFFCMLSDDVGENGLAPPKRLLDLQADHGIFPGQSGHDINDHMKTGRVGDVSLHGVFEQSRT